MDDRQSGWFPDVSPPALYHANSAYSLSQKRRTGISKPFENTTLHKHALRARFANHEGLEHRRESRVSYTRHVPYVFRCGCTEWGRWLHVLRGNTSSALRSICNLECRRNRHLQGRPIGSRYNVGNASMTFPDAVWRYLYALNSRP